MAYDEAYFRTREIWRDRRIEAHELVRHAGVNPGALALEVGCGGGRLMRMLRQHGAAVVGIDTSETALNLAQRQGIGACALLVRIGKNAALPFRDGTFDAIIGQHVIEHLPDIGAALAEWHRLLKPQGCLALATPNALYADPAHFADADHTRIFSPDELVQAVEQAGFVTDTSFTVFPYLSRARLIRAVSVVGYRLFLRIPRFSGIGRTIIMAARKE